MVLGLGAIACTAGIVFASPALGQASPQVAHSLNGAQTFDLMTLQRTGPGGDLASTFQATTQSNGGRANTAGQEGNEECLFLDSYNPINTYDGSVASALINTVQTTNTLTAGQPYVINITGTVSYWGASYYTAPVGSPEPYPMFLSPAVAPALQGDVASDWEYLFAYPNNSHGNLFVSGPGHIPYQGISLDDGATFEDLVPLGGQFYTPSHSYSYLVEGQGQQAEFNISDFGPHDDNYGMYKICIRQAASCVYTQGYWGNKPGVVWPDSYSRTAMFFLSGQTWQQVMDTPVSVSPGYYQLADQFIAAILNQFDGAPVPSGVQDTLNLAKAWFGTNGTDACAAHGSCAVQKTWAGILDSYNNGLYPGGPSRCD